MSAALRQAAAEADRLAQCLDALKALSDRQTTLPCDDADAWAALQRRKRRLYDDLGAMRLPDLFLRLRRLADSAPGDDDETAAARRHLADAAEGSIGLMKQIAACEADARERLAQGMADLKQQGAALRHTGELHRTYRASPAAQPRFLDARE